LDFLVRLGLNFQPVGDFGGMGRSRLGLRHFLDTDGQKRDYLSRASHALLRRGATKKTKRKVK